MLYFNVQDAGVTSYFETLLGEINHFPMQDIGDIIVNQVRQTILEIPLYKTGALYESISAEYTSNNEVIVDSGVDYAVYLDEGTKYIDAHHFLEFTPEMESEIDSFLDRFWGEDYEPYSYHP